MAQYSRAKREGRRVPAQSGRGADFLRLWFEGFCLSECRRMHHFTPIFQNFPGGQTPDPLVLGWWGAQCEIFSYSGSKYNYDACWLDMWIIRKGNIIPWTYSLYNRQYWMSFKSVKISGGVLLIISDMNFIPHTSKPHTNHKYFKRRLIFISNIWSINTQNARNCIFCLLVNEIFGGCFNTPLWGGKCPGVTRPKFLAILDAKAPKYFIQH